MTSTAEEPGPYDALAKARPDEPIFTLLARDPHAPATVRHWVTLARGALFGDLAGFTDKRGAFPTPDSIRAELDKCTDAEMVAIDMARWAKGEAEHDTTTPKRASYSGVTHSDSAMDDVARKSAIAAAVAQLREAAYFASEGRDALHRLGILEPAETISLEAALTSINAVADVHAPKRPGVQPELGLPEPEGAEAA